MCCSSVETTVKACSLTKTTKSSRSNAEPRSTAAAGAVPAAVLAREGRFRVVTATEAQVEVGNDLACSLRSD